ncbi:hypothetical protein CHCC14809_0361 [Bacillus licheniformis]|nr:hypothetical protein B4090_3048 [Bacillus licheniformis]OLF90481.1 hypothetical protein B4089_2806 [Bacillus licheniformis]TWK07021.1 hypothetical protein CHCC20442_0206 [Bacillus licheniformis]TWK07945.1 hypothetical protein CHCC20487_0356 [Bacillus licheniformis]TWK35182.1 hypothetical protein CHCC20369_4370 [Bacillus licheniformis]
MKRMRRYSPTPFLHDAFFASSIHKLSFIKTKDRGIGAHFACICSFLLVSMKNTKNLYFLKFALYR